MQTDTETLVALLILAGPVAVLAYRHQAEWGGDFGPSSGLWNPATVLAASLLLTLVASTAWLGADELRAAMGSRRSRGYLPFFLLPGVGLAIALLPGPASEVAGKYKALAANQATRTYAWVGWGLVSVWGLLLLLGWFARMYRS